MFFNYDKEIALARSISLFFLGSYKQMVVESADRHTAIKHLLLLSLGRLLELFGSLLFLDSSKPRTQNPKPKTLNPKHTNASM